MLILCSESAKKWAKSLVVKYNIIQKLMNDNILTYDGFPTKFGLGFQTHIASLPAVARNGTKANFTIPYSPPANNSTDDYPVNNLVIYDDKVESPFINYSWATVNASATSPVHSGSNSINDTLGNWDALYFNCDQCFDTDLYKGVEFWVYGGTQIPGGQLIGVSLIKYDGTNSNPQGTFAIGSLIEGGQIPYGQWARAFLDFSDVVPGTYDGFWLQASSSSPQGFVFVDDIVILTKYVPTNNTGLSSTTTGSNNTFSTTTSSSSSSSGSTTGVGSTTKGSTTSSSGSSTTHKGVTSTTAVVTANSLESSSNSLFNNLNLAIVACLCVFILAF
eukprot:TRINITY_DN3796_c0_g1_i1.p1 TRINITY_DN3796_c0_g1~~TRINITY_DN3796_c0_g1_i1.p1  ORF type:complete len:332 (+),score=56.66 TRINITY_DN3796_c0_g1_i1:1272-2267(+)